MRRYKRKSRGKEGVGGILSHWQVPPSYLKAQDTALLTHVWLQAHVVV